MNLKFLVITFASLIYFVEVFNGTIKADRINRYKYVALKDGKVVEEEKLTRIYSKKTKEINEVYNRTNKKYDVPDLPEPFKPMFKMGTKDFEPLPKNVIYNLYAKCDKEIYSSLSNEPFLNGEEDHVNNKTALCTFSIITPKSVFETSGSIHLIGWLSRHYKKLSWSVKFDREYLGRKSFKLRALPNDPTLIREKLAMELYNAVGVPTQEGAYARLFINQDTYGLYSIIDTFSKRWLQGYVHGDSEARIGISYRLNSDDNDFSTFQYLGEDHRIYEGLETYEIDEFDKKEIDPNDGDAKWKRLIEFTKLYNDWVAKYGQDNSEKAIIELNKFLNVENLLRLMAVESLIVPLDNFWLYTANTALYYNPERENYQFIPYDFDQSLGGWMYDDNLNYETVFTDCIHWAHEHDDILDHSFVKSFMRHPQIKKRFLIILSNATRKTFNPSKVNRFIDALANVIREDITWNFDAMDKLNTTYEGYVNHYTFEDFSGNINSTPIEKLENVREDETMYGLKDFVKRRGEGCKANTKSVKNENNINISDNIRVEVYRN
ncbi:coth protein-domain-containing protein [Neocallimastix sp. 'constans']